MCNFASFILTKSAEYWSASSDSHETIIEEHHLSDGPERVQIVRVELTPPEDDPRCADLARWSYRLDQDVLPEWTFAADPSLEARTRSAAALRAEAEQWWLTAEGDGSTVGYAGTATAGDYGTATAGDHGTATAGYAGTATAGARGTATAGNDGTATAGYDGTATAGDYGTATAGYDGTATAGYDAIISVRYWDFAAERWRLAVGYTGEDGILPGVAYCVRNGRLVRKDGEP